MSRKNTSGFWNGQWRAIIGQPAKRQLNGISPRQLNGVSLAATGEALPKALGNKGNRAFISGEQGNKCQILRGTGEQREYLETGNIRQQIFDFWGTGEQENLSGGPHWWRALFT